MADYVIVTDSTADLPSEVYSRMGVEVVPMEFIMGDTVYQHYADAREMGFEEFYSRVKAGEKVSTTQINYYTYEQVFLPILEAGKDIIYICFSSGLSGTYQGSKLAAEDLLEKFPERKISCIDSLCASIGEGLLVYRAALLQKSGMGFEELEKWVYDNRLHSCHWFVVDDLEHLRQGGRISTAQAILGTALNVKPMLSVDDDGQLVPVIKLRGTRKIMETFCRKIETDGDHVEEQTVIIGHAGAPGMAAQLEAVLKERGLIKDAIITDIGPIIGAHVGAGMFALVFMGKRNLGR